MRTSTASRTCPTGRARIRTRSPTERSTRRRSCSRAHSHGFGRNYSKIAFETDLPAIEAEGAQDNPPFCDLDTGANCVNPPDGASFYPLYTTGIHDGTCTWQEGGNFIPGTINHFGGQLHDRVRRSAASGVPGAWIHYL